MNEEEQEYYNKIRTHLAKLHKEWQEDPEYDGHCKSNEGYVGIIFDAGNWFDCERDEQKYINAPLKVTMVEVYSYLFGPNRLHTYYSLKEAWEAVKEW